MQEADSTSRIEAAKQTFLGQRQTFKIGLLYAIPTAILSGAFFASHTSPVGGLVGGLAGFVAGGSIIQGGGNALITTAYRSEAREMRLGYYPVAEGTLMGVLGDVLNAYRTKRIINRTSELGHLDGSERD